MQRPRRNQGKIAATENDKRYIEERINVLREEGRDIAKGKGREALIEASKYLINHEISQLQTYSLSLSWLNDSQDFIFYVTDRYEFEAFKDKVRQHPNKSFSTLELEDLINKRAIRANDISDISWRDFHTGNKIYISIFEAYCDFLGFDDYEIEALRDCRRRSSKSRYENLFRHLQEFDHSPQVTSFKTIVQKSHRTGFFIINSHCRYRTNWLMYRLENTIHRYSNFEVKKLSHDFASAVNSNEISSLYTCLQRDLGVSFSEALKHRNIVLVFKNIDLLDSERLMQLISQVYDEACKEMSNSRRFLIVFAVDIAFFCLVRHI